MMLALLAISMPALASDETHLSAHGLTMAGDATRTRVLLRFDRDPEPRWFLLRDPHRLVVDLPETEFRIQADEVEPRGLVSRFQHGQLGEGTSRLIVTADGPFVVDGLDRHPDGSLRSASLFRLPACDNITLIRFDGPLYFANAGHFEDKILDALSKKPALRSEPWMVTAPSSENVEVKVARATGRPI
jgi:hypothetical protein